MSHFVSNISNLGRKSDFGVMGALGKVDPAARLISKADIGTQNFILGKPQYGNYYGTPAPAPPGPPTQDTAANATLQQQEMLRRRRGVLANIFGGATTAPTVVSKTLLGS